MPNQPEQEIIIGPALPGELHELAAKQQSAAEITSAIEAEKTELSQLPPNEQARLAGHIAMLNEDTAGALKMQADLDTEAKVRTDINRADLRQRLNDQRATESATEEVRAFDPVTNRLEPISRIAEHNRAATDGAVDRAGRY